MRRLTMSLVCMSVALLWSAKAAAQMPVPTKSTSTVHGGTPMDGTALVGEVGYAAVRTSFYTGSASRDFGLELAAPTFGNDTLPGWGQSLGIDLRAPFRFLVADWARANGAFKIGPYFHAGRACWGRGRHVHVPGPAPDIEYDVDRHCGVRSVGIGANLGFITDFPLPKLFKIIVGMEQQFGLLNLKNRDADLHSNDFAGATWVDLGVEAFWRNFFFLAITNAGAQYGSDRLYYRDHALFRQMLGVGLKL